MKSEMPIPLLSDNFALLIKPAPIFWATKALKLCEIAAGINRINPQTFSATPTPAEAISPSEFTDVCITKNDIPTKKSCKAIGNPNFNSALAKKLLRRMYFLWNSKGNFCFVIIII